MGGCKNPKWLLPTPGFEGCGSHRNVGILDWEENVHENSKSVTRGWSKLLDANRVIGNLLIVEQSGWVQCQEEGGSLESFGWDHWEGQFSEGLHLGWRERLTNIN